LVVNEITRSRLKLLVILVVAVVLVHIAVIRFLFFGGNSTPVPPKAKFPEPELLIPEGGFAAQPQKKASKPQKKTEVARSEKAPKMPETKPADLPKAPEVLPPPAPEPPNPVASTPIEKHPSPKIRSLNYTGCVKGDIKGLPEPEKIPCGILVDLNTRKVLWAKNPHKSVPIASMTKMMTILLAFEAMERGELSLDTPVKVSREATKLREGVIYVDVRETFPLRDLLMAATIKSANDAAYLIAETVSGGNVPKFVERMNQRAFELGMRGTKFTNPHGLPNKENGDSVSTPEAMVLLGEAIMQYPQIMQWTSTKQTFIRDGKTELTSTNKLIVPHYPGVDGLKTGYTKHAGSCLTFSCLRNGRRLVGMVAGVRGSQVRDRFCRKLLDWGYQH